MYVDIDIDLTIHKSAEEDINHNSKKNFINIRKYNDIAKVSNETLDKVKLNSYLQISRNSQGIGIF